MSRRWSAMWIGTQARQTGRPRTWLGRSDGEQLGHRRPKRHQPASRSSAPDHAENRSSDRWPHRARLAAERQRALGAASRCGGGRQPDPSASVDTPTIARSRAIAEPPDGPDVLLVLEQHAEGLVDELGRQAVACRAPGARRPSRASRRRPGPSSARSPAAAGRRRRSRSRAARACPGRARRTISYSRCAVG